MKNCRTITALFAVSALFLCACSSPDQTAEEERFAMPYKESEKTLNQTTWIINPENSYDPASLEKAKQDMVHFSLILPEDTPPENSSDAVSSILDRLSLFSEGQEFMLAMYDDKDGQTVHEEGSGVPEKISVWYDASLFKDEIVSDTVKSCISRPMNLFLYEYSDGSVRNNGIALQKDAIASIEAGTGSAEGIDEADFSTGENGLCWLKITLTPEYTSVHREFLDECGDRLLLLQDADVGGSLAGSHLVRISGSEWYAVFEDDVSPARQRLMLHNYTHDPLPSAWYVTDISEPADWQTPDQDNTHLQVSREEISGDRIHLQITAGDQAFSDEAWLDMTEMLRARLDIIGIPYCIGTSVISDRILYVETPVTSHSGVPVYQLLCTGNGMFLAATTQSWLRFDEQEKAAAQIITQEDTITGMSIDVSESYILKLFNESQDGLNLSAQSIYLTDYNYFYLESEMNETINDGKLFMTLCPDRKGIGNSYKKDGWFYELIAEVITHPLPDDPKWAVGIYNEDGTDITDFDRFAVR